MEFFGLEGIWSGGGREGADIIVGFSKMLEFAVTVGGSWSWECWRWGCRSIDSPLIGDKAGLVFR